MSGVTCVTCACAALQEQTAQAGYEAAVTGTRACNGQTRAETWEQQGAFLQTDQRNRQGPYPKPESLCSALAAKLDAP